MREDSLHLRQFLQLLVAAAGDLRGAGAAVFQRAPEGRKVEGVEFPKSVADLAEAEVGLEQGELLEASLAAQHGLDLAFVAADLLG